MTARALPPGESPQRDTVCDALSTAMLYCGDLAFHAGERTTVDLRDRGHVRALARLLTTRHPDGRDGSLGENTRQLWSRIAYALDSDSEYASAGGGVPANPLFSVARQIGRTVVLRCNACGCERYGRGAADAHAHRHTKTGEARRLASGFSVETRYEIVTHAAQDDSSGDAARVLGGTV